MKLTRRAVLATGCSVGATALLPWNSLAQTPGRVASVPRVNDPIRFVNPELRPALEQLIKTMGPMADMNASNLPAMRQMPAQWAQPMLAAPAVKEQMIRGAKGSPDVRIYVINASPGSSKPAVLHIHGGGYIIGSPATDRRNLQQLALDHDCVVVSVDYRLAPETRFPGSLEDNYAALTWLSQNADSLGVDSKRIALKGESAGGGHAAALAIAARDRGEVPLCFQLLIYPMLDDRTGSTNMLPAPFGSYTWTAGSNRFGWSSLLGVPAGSANVPRGSVPARVADLSGLPPAFIGVGSIDLFALEDIDYAQRLLRGGVQAELNVVPGAFHGFDGIVPDASISQQFTHAWNEALRRAFVKAS